MTSSKKPSNSSAKNENLYAIAETSGQQFWFEVDKYYDIDRLNAKEKDKITIDKILLIKDKDNISLGQPYVKNAKIELEVVSHKRDKKINKSSRQLYRLNQINKFEPLGVLII